MSASLHAQGKKHYEANAPQEWELFEDIPLDMQPRPLLKVGGTHLTLQGAARPAATQDPS